MQRHHFDGEIIAPRNVKSWVRWPTDTGDVISVKVSILLIENQGWVSLIRCRWALKDLEPLACSDCKEPWIWWEGQCCNWVSEVKMGNNYLFLVINEKCKAIHINGDKQLAIWRYDNPIDVASILKRQCSWCVAELINKINVRILIESVFVILTYFVRSNIVSLLPTGLRRIWFLALTPSMGASSSESLSVKRTLPPAYTVPQRFEN